MQIACTFVAYSALASNSGIGPKGLPVKSISSPAAITLMPGSQRIQHPWQFHIKELCFINAHHFHITRHQQDLIGMCNRCGMDVISIVRYNFGFVVTHIIGRLKNLHLLVGNFGTLQSADEFFGFTGKHATADHFNPACPLLAYIRFGEHAAVKIK